MNPLEAYLHDLHQIRSTGANLPETSYYPSLQNLLNEIGKTLKPKVRCVMGIADQGAGFPDGGLFTPDQFQKSAAVPLPDQLPSRGVIEVKAAADDAWVTADGPQVSRYWGKYRSVLVTNYRDFVLLGRDAEGRAAKLETYRLADGEHAFWAAAAHPRKTADAHAERFTEYLKRVLLHEVPLASPQALAWFLASYARDAKARVEQAGDLPALAAVRQALEDALGLKFEGEKGEHFFRSSLVQTLFYGVFSAWVLWAKRDHVAQPPSAESSGVAQPPPAESFPARVAQRPSAESSQPRAAVPHSQPHSQAHRRFDSRMAVWSLRVPMVRALFEQVATPAKLGPLGLVEVLDWAEAALNRVDREAFFAQFHEGQAVQYFYEPFLQAFDPELRKDLGVWFTPPEIVQYMVARVDTVLREELDIEDGLADPRVYVLDPCCGTGSYLVEVLHRIAATLKEKGGDALVAADLKRAAVERIFGFEILPAPFVVAHLQLGLLLDGLGSPLDEDRYERAAVYLTNALTGWEPPEGPKQHLIFPELEQERDAADKVKQETPILVILGNPPYNAFAGTSPEEEQGLLDPYKDGLADRGITKNYLDDLYVRFLRIAERRVAEMTKTGVVCYISNFSYVGDSTFVVMRKRFVEEFDQVWIDCMNGSSRETGKLTPDGEPDPSVFSTEYNRQGIRVGTAVGLFVRRRSHKGEATVRFRHFWGAKKRTDLVQSLKVTDIATCYRVVKPSDANKYTFRPGSVGESYASWPTVAELCARAPMLGLNENRGGALQDIGRERLITRMVCYLSKESTWEDVVGSCQGLAKEAAGFEPTAVRAKMLSLEPFEQARVVRYMRRPFDIGWAYVSDVSPLWNRSRPELRSVIAHSPLCILTRPAGVVSPEGIPFMATTLIGEQDAMRGHAYYFPVTAETRAQVKAHGGPVQKELIPGAHGQVTTGTNLSRLALSYLSLLGAEDGVADPVKAGLVWLHVLATGYCPAYLAENADGLRQAWPRIPLPNTKELLESSAALGRQVAALLDTESGVKAVTSGKIRAELRVVGVVSRVGGGSLNTNAGELALTAGWGHGGKGGVTMPGKGKAEERAFTADELAAIESGAAELGLSREQAIEHLGKTTFDIYLNGVAYWRNVPARVWDYTIGGYQVMKKWLSYRERDLLGRPLSLDEAHYVTEMARRIAALVLLEPALDANYEAVKANTYAWPGK